MNRRRCMGSGERTQGGGEAATREGADLESKDGLGRTPLSWAVERGHEAVVKLLLEKEAYLESRTQMARRRYRIP
jgi:ankyrin repeat protein